MHHVNKKKNSRGNQMPFFNKELSKAIMTRTKLQNIVIQNRIRYTKQRNFFVSPIKKTKKRYENLNEKFVVDNKPFWENSKTSPI